MIALNYASGTSRLLLKLRTTAAGAEGVAQSCRSALAQSGHRQITTGDARRSSRLRPVRCTKTDIRCSCLFCPRKRTCAVR